MTEAKLTRQNHRKSAPWVPIKHGERIRPQKDQRSNNHFADELVLQPRAEKVGKSFAKPLRGTENRAEISYTPGQKVSDGGPVAGIES